MNVLVDCNAHPVIAHRGNAAHIPENTIHSFDEAVALGVDALEFDLRLSKDGVPMVIHDDRIDRTTDGRGSVASYTVSELQQFDAGYRFTRDHGATYPWRARGHAIPTFEDVLTRYPEIPLLIELKEPAVTGPALEMLRDRDPSRRIVLASGVHAAVQPCRDQHLTSASPSDLLQLLRELFLGRALGELPYECISMPRWYHGIPLPVKRIAAAAHNMGVATHVWTIDVPALAHSLWRRGVNGIVTNDPGAMLPVRRELFGGVRDRRRPEVAAER